ncbi:MAG: homocitrate synthase/isopropylmalate synthase family protein [bacterium]
MPKIFIIDVTNRDGVQTSRLGLAKLEKTMINLYLNEMGIFQSEFGFPYTYHEMNYIDANLELARRGVLAPIRLEGWCPMREGEIRTSFGDSRLEHCNLSISTSEQMTEGKFGGRVVRAPEEDPDLPNLLDMMRECVSLARELGAKSVGVNAEDASRTDDEFLVRFGKAAKEAGADRFRYCDTLGYNDPLDIYRRCRMLAEEVGLDLELHCHNDLGMAVACSVAGAKGAVDGGVDAYINTSVNGMGERAGNADLVSVILAMQKSSGLAEEYALDERVDLSKAWKTAKYVSYAFGVPIPINQVGVGDNAFAHESGIHADGALKDRRNYELYNFEDLGRGEPDLIDTGRQITCGEYSGIKGFRDVYGRLEIEFHNDEEAREILELARYANVHTQKPLTNEELRFIANYPDLARKILTMTPLAEMR